jgi:repressor LexA
MDFQDDFIANLKFYRKENKISQEKLAELCDCATSTIGCIESGRQTPSFELLVKIAKALNISPADLFLRNASSTVRNTKSVLKTKLLPQIEDFIEKEL